MFWFRTLAGRSELRRALVGHFAGTPLARLVSAAREFPIATRVDVQTALESALSSRSAAAPLGIHSPMDQQPPTVAHLISPGPFPLDIGPLQYEEIDVGDPEPARCLRNALWLAREAGLPFAVLLVAGATPFGQSSVRVEIAVPAGDGGASLSQRLFRDLETRVAAGTAYKGRVISLESHFDYSGRGGSVKVHRLRRVAREELILPAATLALLDRNVLRFLDARERLKAMRFQAKKGLLFHGPPGTGKTHTIHYLASELPGHTTLLVTAEQVVMIGEYFRLARFLQPALMVIEDVDLIARERGELQHPGQEILLNKLLNEMDGLREDADVLFILTTNRPDALEPALAARPGRIDQAIEFALPDAEGRARLVALYSYGLEVPDAIGDLIVRRTHGASPAFIKELMRRAAQFQVAAADGARLDQPAVDAAIEEMVVLGGALNLKLLGGSLSPSPPGNLTAG